MKKFRVYAVVTGGKYLGEVEANSADEAIDIAFGLPTCSVSLCHQCARECDDAQISKIEAEEV